MPRTRLVLLATCLGETQQLLSVSLDDPGDSRLVGEGTSPAWSPDGERLLFVDGF